MLADCTIILAQSVLCMAALVQHLCQHRGVYLCWLNTLSWLNTHMSGIHMCIERGFLVLTQGVFLCWLAHMSVLSQDNTQLDLSYVDTHILSSAGGVGVREFVRQLWEHVQNNLLNPYKNVVASCCLSSVFHTHAHAHRHRHRHTHTHTHMHTHSHCLHTQHTHTYMSFSLSRTIVTP